MRNEISRLKELVKMQTELIDMIKMEIDRDCWRDAQKLRDKINQLQSKTGK